MLKLTSIFLVVGLVCGFVEAVNTATAPIAIPVCSFAWSSLS